jgi:tRNA pseudouridine38-40 synthase
VKHPLDLDRMRSAAGRLLGKHDFRAFGNTGSPRKSTVRTLSHAHLVARRKGLALVFQADGFLYNMVRNLAGTLLEIGLGTRAPEDVERALATGERDAAGATAPACGLYLVSVQYPERPFRTVDDAGAGAPGAFGPRH